MDFDYCAYDKALGQFVTIEEGREDKAAGTVTLQGRLRPLGPDGEPAPGLSLPALARSAEALFARVSGLGWRFAVHPQITVDGSVSSRPGEPDRLTTTGAVTLVIRPARGD